jgi:hypothetical protein
VGVIDASGRAEARGEYRSFRTVSLQIASQLAAYFPRSGPEVDWDDYTFSLRNIYLALTSEPGRARNQWLHWLNRYFDLPPETLVGLCSSTRRGLRQVVLRFQHKEEEVVREIVASPTVLTGTPTPDVTVAAKRFEEGQPGTCS